MKRNTWKKGFVLIVIAIFVATMNIPSICANFIDSMNINTSPGIPEIWGQIQVEINKVAHYFAKTNYSGDSPIYFKWNWGDGTESDWTGPFYNHGEGIVSGHFTHSWEVLGVYNIKAKAIDDPNDDGDLSDGQESDWSDELEVHVKESVKIVQHIGGLGHTVVFTNDWSKHIKVMHWSISFQDTFYNYNTSGKIFFGRETSGSHRDIPPHGQVMKRTRFLLGFGRIFANWRCQIEYDDGSTAGFWNWIAYCFIFGPFVIILPFPWELTVLENKRLNIREDSFSQIKLEEQKICYNITCGSNYISGNTLYVGGGGPGNYTSIQDAIDNASDGDTVFVYAYSSPYYEDIVINKSINLIGEEKETTIIDCNVNGSIMIHQVDNVNISGFTIQNGNTGIRIYESKFCTIQDNIIARSTMGIRLSGADHNTINRNQIFDNNGPGLSLSNLGDSGSSYNSISSNLIYNNSNGCNIQQGSNNRLFDNLIVDCTGSGIVLIQTGITTIYRNTIEHRNTTGTSIYAWQCGLTLAYNNNILTSSDRILYASKSIILAPFNYWGPGILFPGVLYTEHKNNSFVFCFPWRLRPVDISIDIEYIIENYFFNDNNPPEPLIIQGPLTGNLERNQNFLITLIDPDGDDVQFFIDWGDGANTGWSGPWPSGEAHVKSHHWDEEGTYFIKAKAKDIHGAESNESTHIIHIVNRTNLKRTLLCGFISDWSEDRDFFHFRAKGLMFLQLIPFHFRFFSSDELIIIGDDYPRGNPGGFIITFWDAIVIDENWR